MVSIERLRSLRLSARSGQIPKNQNKKSVASKDTFIYVSLVASRVSVVEDCDRTERSQAMSSRGRRGGGRGGSKGHWGGGSH